jgi:hypothetical protein
MRCAAILRKAQEPMHGTLLRAQRKARAQACVQLDGSCAPLFAWHSALHFRLRANV